MAAIVILLGLATVRRARMADCHLACVVRHARRNWLLGVRGRLRRSQRPDCAGMLCCYMACHRRLLCLGYALYPGRPSDAVALQVMEPDYCRKRLPDQ